MQRLTLPEFGPAGDRDAAWLIDQAGTIIAKIAQPVDSPESDVLREAVVGRVFDEDVGDAVLAGVAIASHRGGDAIGFT